MASEPMRPEDVPDDLMSKGRGALVEHLRNLATTRIPTLEEEARAVLAAVLPEHKRQVRAEVADEIETTATYDAARRKVDDGDGHEDHCEWHLTNGCYCSCRVWTAACAGVNAAAQIARGEAP